MIRRIRRIAMANCLQCCLIFIGCGLFCLCYFTLPPKFPEAKKVMVPFPQGARIEKYGNVVTDTFKHEKTLSELLIMAWKKPEELLVVYKNSNLYNSDQEIIDYWFPGPGSIMCHASYEIPKPSSWSWRYTIIRLEYSKDSGDMFVHPDVSGPQMAITLVSFFSGLIIVLIGGLSWWNRISSKG